MMKLCKQAEHKIGSSASKCSLRWYEILYAFCSFHRPWSHVLLDPVILGSSTVELQIKVWWNTTFERRLKESPASMQELNEQKQIKSAWEIVAEVMT